jgi:hypothetical protein
MSKIRLKDLECRVVLVLAAIALIAGIANNLRVSPDKRVTWFGGQQVLAKPAGY